MTDKPTDAEKVGYVDELYHKGNQARWMYLNQWMQNYFFLVGNQYVRWVGNGESGKWEVYPEIEGKIQYVNNKILPASGMTLGRMIKDDMQQIVLHANNDEKSIDSAKAASRFLEYLWRTDDGDSMLLEVALWSQLTGIGVTKTYVDLDKGPTKKGSKLTDGEVCVDIISPFEFVIPPNARTMKKLPWAMHARMETKEYVFEKWGIEAEGTGNADTWAMYQAVNLDIMGDGAFFGANTQFSDDTVLVKELWIRPCKNYPNGRVIITAGTTLVHDEDIPFDKDYWPFNWLPFRNVPFRFWPMSMIEPMIDPQKAINDLSSNVLENIRYMGKPVILAPTGAVDPDSFVAESGAVWEWNPGTGAKPEFVTPNPVPPVVYQEISSQESHIYDLAGMHMLGSGMSGMRAAAAIMLVQQQDETAFTPVMENVKGFLKRDAELKLFLAQKAFTVPRKIKILGEENQWQVTEFNASDLSGDEEIHIQSKQDLANDKATRFNQILSIINQKDDDNTSLLDKQAKLRLLGDAGIDNATYEYDLDFNRAKWENEQLQKGKDVAVNDYDDHSVHIKVHNQDRKRIDFENLPKHVKDAYALHVQAHEQMLQQQSPMQTQAKGDDMVGNQQPGMPQQPGMMQPPMQGPPQQLPPGMNMPGFNGASALQSGISRVNNLIGMGGQQG